MDKLKPCPFCGGDNLYVDGYEHGAGTRWRVVCLSCMGMVDSGTVQQKHRAIEAWNRRPQCWTPVTERLPEVDKYGDVNVLVCMDDGFIATATYADDWELWDDSGEVTHWMPLPEPPEEGDNDTND